MAQPKKPGSIVRARFAALTLSKKFNKPETGEEDRATIKWSTRASYPRVTLTTSVDAYREDHSVDFSKLVIAPFTHIALTQFIEYCIKFAGERTKNASVSVDCINNKFINDQRSNEKYVAATVILSSDDQGKLSLGIKGSEKPLCTIDLHPGDRHHFKHNGELITNPTTLSREFAKAYFTSLGKHTDIVALDSIVTTADDRDASIVKTRYPLLSLTKKYNKEGDGGEDTAIITWSSRKGFLKLRLTTSKDAYKEDSVDYDKVVIAPFTNMDLRSFVIRTLELLEEGKPSTSVAVECHSHRYENDKMLEEMYTQATVKVGITKEGMAYLSIKGDGKPAIAMTMEQPEWHVFKKDGDPYADDGALSRDHAKAYFQELLNYVDAIDTSRIVKVKDDGRVKANEDNDKIIEKPVPDSIDAILNMK